MVIANLDDLPDLIRIFNKYPEEIGAVSKASIKDAVVGGRVIYRDGVALMFTRTTNASYYGVRVGKGAWQVVYIASDSPGGGKAKAVFSEFLGNARTPVFLLVKTSNDRAVAFYEKFGFKKAKVVSFKTFNSFLMVKHV